MPRLLLFRHARAAWANAGSGDFDRALTESGRKDARAIAEAMYRRGYVPDAVICSTARRAWETWAEAAQVLAHDRQRFSHCDALYNTDAQHYLKIVHEAPQAEALLLIGHNPMLEDFAFALAGSGAPEQVAALRNGLPTAGAAILSFAGDLDGIQPGSGFLEAYLSPALLPGMC